MPVLASRRLPDRPSREAVYQATFSEDDFPEEPEDEPDDDEEEEADSFFGSVFVSLLAAGSFGVEDGDEVLDPDLRLSLR